MHRSIKSIKERKRGNKKTATTSEKWNQIVVELNGQIDFLEFAPLSGESLSRKFNRFQKEGQNIQSPKKEGIFQGMRKQFPQ
jgi:hypothetical protein